MKEMTCEAVRDHLPEHLYGRLQSNDATSLDAHLADCADCAAERDLVALLARNPVTVPAGLEARVARAVHAPWRRQWARPLLAAAALSGVLLGGVTWLRMSQQHETAATVIATPVLAGEGRSLIDAMPGAADIGTIVGNGTLNDLTTDQLESLIAELES